MSSSCFPLPSSYAVAEIDLESSFRSIIDPSAHLAAREIKTTKCLVYLHSLQELPAPYAPDFVYYVYLVGPTLRPQNPSLCLTTDMCTPIFPNTAHPTGRAPIRPDPAFPLANCAHWAGPDAALCVRVKRGRYARAEAVELPDDEYLRLERDRAEDAFRARSIAAEVAVKLERSSTPSSLCSSSTTSLSSSSMGSWDDLADFDYDLFEPREGPRKCHIPVVNIWLDIEAHLPPGHVPDPVEFMRQHEAVSQLLREYRTPEVVTIRLDLGMMRLSDSSSEDRARQLPVALARQHSYLRRLPRRVPLPAAAADDDEKQSLSTAGRASVAEYKARPGAGLRGVPNRFLAALAARCCMPSACEP
ncbi:uncharacterized protein BXZ73DRAFT_100548 [Epithele typhae]|uniref:uncharacterized protein n=1 Tax=Epithele typhae TaxID=378194 RepID=UPI00200775C3|nr:uncharacterized protein BXZ73DRAFT_100548 [Epithele typhae]KAH9935161.1 hypothetical protein BXZ73DRAFT_100548 [Epithele typhae]